MGGVAALPRSRRGFWLLVLVVLAALAGFAFVRFFLRPVALHGESGPVGATGTAAGELLPWKA
jgi:hypothetical protein